MHESPTELPTASRNAMQKQHEPDSGRSKPRSRASQACLVCRARKVRCDLQEQQPCTNCAAANRPCEPAGLPSARPRSRQQTVPPRRPLEPLAENGPPAGMQKRGRDADNQPRAGAQSVASVPSPADQSRARTVDDDIWARNLQTIRTPASTASHHSASLAESSHTGPRDPDPPPHRKRLRFGDEPLTHSMLPHMDGHAELSVSYDGAMPRRTDRVSLTSTLAPKAIRPYGKSPWINANCQDHLELMGHLSQEDRYYLYSMKKVFHFPQRSVTEAFLTTFFQSVYPLLPIVDRTEITRMFDRLYSGYASSPLLFHALLFCTCQYVDEKVLQDAGFSTAAEAKLYFFHRARALYTFDCEQEHIVVLQSLVMLSYWWMDYTEEKDMRYWLSCAVNLALTLGLHKIIPASLNLPTAKHALWRRIFWSLFGREHNVAIALGQPFLIRLADCDTKPLQKDDFMDNDSAVEVLPCQASGSSASTLTSCHSAVMIKHVELACQVENLLLAIHEAKSHQRVLETIESMASIVDRSRVLTSDMHADGFSIDDGSTWSTENVFVAFHVLNHERVVTLYNRKYERVLVGLKRTTLQDTHDETRYRPRGTAEPPVGNLDAKLRDARLAIFASAHRMVQIFRCLQHESLAKLTPSFVTTSTFHALLSLSEEIAYLGKGTAEREQVKAEFFEALQFVGALRRYWSSASWSFSMYSIIAEDDFQALKVSKDQALVSLHTRPSSRLPSRVGSPGFAANGEIDLTDFVFDFSDPMVPLPDGFPFSMDSWDSWNLSGGLDAV